MNKKREQKIDSNRHITENLQINNKKDKTPIVYAKDQSSQKFKPKEHAKKLNEDEDESLSNLKRSKKERKYKRVAKIVKCCIKK